jgi:hypothetical protein
MTRQKMIEKIREELENIGDACEQLKMLSIKEIEDEESEELHKLEYELDVLNGQINRTTYRSKEFYELESKIKEKEKEIDELRDKESSNNEEIDDKLSYFLDKLQEFAHDTFDTEYKLYEEANEFD